MASKLYWYFAGPRLLRLFRTSAKEGRNYEPNVLESFPDRVIQTLHAAYGIVYWTSPIVGIFLYRRGFFSQEGFMSLLRISISVAFVYTLSKVIRGFGRISNADYRNFITTLVDARANPTLPNLKALAGFDFEFWAWPVNFRWDEGHSDKKRYQPVPSSTGNQTPTNDNIFTSILGYVAMHTFGRRMVYPGATSVMNYALSGMLASGRAILVEEKKADRAKLLTEDNNEIDTMFVDRRGKYSHNRGDSLVITFEGNAGFYEVGCTGTPLDKEYSVLMWNHPGFGGSTGVPFPDQEQRAIDVVIQYALTRLDFKPENIILFAWSIGGYSATWAAKSYPDIQFVVLDATFDHLVPLAIAKMPTSLKNIVVSSVTKYMNLNIAEQLVEYNGPVLFIRRTRDEMISTLAPVDRIPVIATNRGNFLLLTLLQHRYPTIVDDTTLPVMMKFLSLETFRQSAMLNEKRVSPSECNTIFIPHVQDNGLFFPMDIDLPENSDNLKEKLALFLITVHMENFESTHCSPLPGDFLHKPWIPGRHYG